MKQSLRALAFLFICLSPALLLGQFSVSQGGTVTLTCGAPAVMTDSDADGGNYAANEVFETTFCPGDGGNAVFITFNNNPNTWDVGAGDFVSVYDGTDTSAPLLGTINTTIDANGQTFFSSLTNVSGCLTVVFTSDAIGTNAGWDAPITCGTVWQPYTVEITTNPEPSENGSTDICEETEIVYTALLDFPNNDFGGDGYIQSVENTYFFWDMGDGSIFEGLGLDEVTYTYTGPFAYEVNLLTTDVEGQFQTDDHLVRTSITPSFAGVVSQAVSPTCVGVEGTLFGGVTQDTTNFFGVSPNAGTLFFGGIVGDQIFLPDGSGEVYETSINISGYPDDAVLSTLDDIISICVNMEHSYIGDLEMLLTCPDGTTLPLFNAFSGAGELIPGGFGGGGTYLGNANDDTSDPGEGFTYCFTADATTLLGDGNTIPVDTGIAIEPGDYAPEEPMDNLLGCPINGEWTLTIQDNLGIDDGWIFSWSILFGADISPDPNPYFNTYVSYEWSDSPWITSVNNDTLINYVIDEPGSENFTFNVTDDFGCSYDTTVVINVLERPDLFIDEQGFLCSNANLNVEVLNQDWPNYGYAWQPEDLVTSPFTNETTVLDLTQDTEFTVTVFPTDLPQCVSQASILVPFEESQPLAVTTNEAISNCPGTPIEIISTVTGGINDYVYNWSVGGTDPSVIISPDLSQNITLEVSDACETVILPIQVTVNDPGGLIIVDPLSDICIGESVQFSIAGGTGNYFYDVPAGLNLNDGNNTIIGTAGNYTIDVNDDCYATGEFDLNVIVCDITLFPNIISPNGDNLNSSLTFPGLEFFPGGSKLQIFNRWGTLVFEDNSYNNDWKGTDLDENDLPEGTYWYVFQPSLQVSSLRDTENIKTSYLTIVR